MELEEKEKKIKIKHEKLFRKKQVFVLAFNFLLLFTVTSCLVVVAFQPCMEWTPTKTLTIKTPKRYLPYLIKTSEKLWFSDVFRGYGWRFGVCFVNFELISHLFLFLLLILNRVIAWTSKCLLGSVKTLVMKKPWNYYIRYMWRNSPSKWSQMTLANN